MGRYGGSSQKRLERKKEEAQKDEAAQASPTAPRSNGNKGPAVPSAASINKASQPLLLGSRVLVCCGRKRQSFIGCARGTKDIFALELKKEHYGIMAPQMIESCFNLVPGDLTMWKDI